MPLELEDGTGVADANSYVTAQDARDYATARGITLPDAQEGSDQVEFWLVLASDYLESLKYVGYRATGAQGLVWPRVLTFPYLDYPFVSSCDVMGFQPLSFDPSLYVLPEKLKAAQKQLVIEQSNGIDLMPSTPGGPAGQFVTREKVDVIETSYSERLGTLATPTMPKVLALLDGLLIPTGLRSVRV